MKKPILDVVALLALLLLAAQPAMASFKIPEVGCTSLLLVMGCAGIGLLRRWLK